MKYISPYKLLAICEPVADSKELAKSKKKMLAEFELAQEGDIELLDYTVDRNTALKLIEELEDPFLASYHFQVYKDNNLLLFLEKGVLGKFSDNEIYEDAEFISFISPYFCEAYNTLLYNAFKKNDLKLLGNINKVKMLVSVKSLDACYQKTVHLIVQKKEEIQTIDRNLNNNMAKETFLPYYNHNIINSLNLLPDYFCSYKDKYAWALLNLSINIYNNNKQLLGYTIIKEVRFIKVSSVIKEEIEAIYKQMPRFSEHEPSQVSTREEASPGWKMILYVIVVLCILISGGRSCKRKSTSNNYIKGETYKVLPLDNQSNGSDPHIESLLSHHKNNTTRTIDEEFKSQDPETGFRPYANVTNPPKGDRKIFNIINIENETSYHVIGFLTKDGKLLNSFYIKSGESLTQYLNGTRSAHLNFYFGKDWDGSLQLNNGIYKDNNGRLFLSEKMQGAFRTPMPDYQKYLQPEAHIKIYFPAHNMGKADVFEIKIEHEADSIAIHHNYNNP